METSWRAPPHTIRPALKPSLVEWKRVRAGLRRVAQFRLETFLSGMETLRGAVPCAPPTSLKPSLVEWKRDYQERAIEDAYAP